MKKGTKKALIIGGSVLGVLIVAPIIINAIRPTGTVNPYYPDEGPMVSPSRAPMSSAPTGDNIRMMAGLW